MRVKDVGRTELGAESYATASRFNARDAVGFGVLQLPTANSLQVYRDVSAEIWTAVEALPAGPEGRARVRHDDASCPNRFARS